MEFRPGRPALPALLAVAFAALPGAHAAAPVEWTLQSPLPTGEDLRAVDMLSAAEGWAVGGLSVGGRGTILHTTDCGATWTLQESPLPDILYAVRFVDALRGCAAGNRIVFTTDGGATWQPANADVSTRYGLDFSDPLNGWTVGTAGQVYRTTNGGADWTFLASAGSSNLLAVDFVSATRGWAVGGSGTILRTSDGGLTWIAQASGTAAWLTAVRFLDENEGWAAGWGEILHTTDGGATWQRLVTLPENGIFGLEFFDSLNGWAVTQSQRIYRTADGGTSWQLAFAGEDSSPLWGVAAGDAAHLVAVGQRGHIFASEDAGLGWASSLNGWNTHAQAFAAVDPLHAWAASVGGLILRTTDGGRDWIRVRVPENAYDLAFLDRELGWAVGDRLAYRTTDGGAAWQSFQTGRREHLHGMDALDANTMVAVGGGTIHGSEIVRTADGGQTWQSVPHPAISFTFYEVDFPTPMVGYAVGTGGGILKSVNGGQSWVAQASPLSVSLYDVSFADAFNGWAISAGGVLLHTADGGANWRLQDPGTTENLTAVSAVSPLVAWISGTGAFIARTTDGGATWVRDTIDVPSGSSVPSLLFLDADRGWASTSSGYPYGQLWRRGPALASAVRGPVAGATAEGGSAGALRIAPNPGSASFTIAYTLARRASVSISLHDVTGRRIFRHEAGSREGGTHAFTWRGETAAGEPAPPGVFFARLAVDGRPAGVERLVRLR